MDRLDTPKQTGLLGILDMTNQFVPALRTTWEATLWTTHDQGNLVSLVSRYEHQEEDCGPNSRAAIRNSQL